MSLHPVASIPELSLSLAPNEESNPPLNPPNLCFSPQKTSFLSGLHLDISMPAGAFPWPFLVLDPLRGKLSIWELQPESKQLSRVMEKKGTKQVIFL